jgi:hypothetical protein
VYLADPGIKLGEVFLVLLQLGKRVVLGLAFSLKLAGVESERAISLV